jgi:hypothetical protein
MEPTLDPTPKSWSLRGNGQRHKLNPVVPRPDAHDDIARAALLRSTDRVVDVSRRTDRIVCDIENNVSWLQALFGCKSVRIDVDNCHLRAQERLAPKSSLREKSLPIRQQWLFARRCLVPLACMPTHPSETADDGAGNKDDGSDEHRSLKQHRLNSYGCSFRRSKSAISSGGNSCGASFRALSP